MALKLSPQSPAPTACTHCQTLFTPTHPGDPFCCGGCASVHHLIHHSGLDTFYSLKGHQPSPPINHTAFHQRDLSWLLPRIAQAEARAHSGPASLDCAVQGLSCVACVWLLERLFLRQPGALRASATVHPGRIHLEWTPGLAQPAAFADSARQFGYLLGPADAPDPLAQTPSSRLGLCAAFAMNAMAFSLPRYLGMEDTFALAPAFLLAAAAAATLAVLTGGSYFIHKAWLSLRLGVLHLDLPIALGILAAYLGSLVGWLLQIPSLIYFDFVAIFTFLMLAGRRLQLSAIHRNRGRLLGHSSHSPAIQSPDGHPLDLAALAKGSPYLLPPGQIVPVASRVAAAPATISLESISGEADPLTVPTGGLVPSGSLHIGRRPLELEALESWDHSLYQRLRNSRESEARHPWLDRVLRLYLAAVLLLALLGGLAWWLATGNPARGLQVLISLLVVSCPCALGVALPLADDLAAAAMERVGVFIRRPLFWPRLAQIRHLIFDKTGTLTLDSPQLTNPESLLALSPDETSALHLLVRHSLHPLSRSLTEALARLPLPPVPSHSPEIQEIPGRGVSFTAPPNTLWSLGHPSWNGPDSSPSSPSSPPPNVTLFRRNATTLAAFHFADAIRPDTRSQLDQLRRQGYSLHILSGDRSPKVAALAQAAGIPLHCAHGNLSPADKAAAVRALDHHNTLYLGDGANDSLAFDQAFLTGTPAIDKGLLENRADFYFLGRSLSFVGLLFDTARRRRRAVRHTAAFALFYNASAAAICLSGAMNPLLAAILMPLSSLATLGLVALHFPPRPAGPRP